VSEPHSPYDTLPTGTVTFLFTDIEGSTDLLQRVGDQAYKGILEQHHDLVRAALVRCDGHEVGTQGDAFFVAFHDAGSALTAAVDVQRAMAGHAWPAGVVIRVRMGLHTGEPALGPTGYVGIDVHRAARICSAGYGQQILLSERTCALAGSRLPEGVSLKDLGEHRLKDLARPEHLFQVVAPGLPVEHPPLKSLDVLRTNLPALELTSFVGREREMADVRRMISQSRLVTLMGPGGAGKTRLALQVAADVSDRFAQGVWLVELGPVDEAEMVVQTAASVFGVREMADRPLLGALAEYLRVREALLVLDNCEHLTHAAANLAAHLLRECPKVRIVATSRETLATTGETVYRVPSLSGPDPRSVVSAGDLTGYDATRLFLERATASNPKFAVTDAAAAEVARICWRLDGIPLAIELAAARVKVLSVEQIARRLDDRFRLLTGGARTGLAHHQTLRAAVDWSYELLAEDERLLLRRLAVFAGALSLEAAEEICAGEGVAVDAVLDLLARLVDKSLVFTEERGADLRYRMLETIRAYGRDRLQEANEADAAFHRHLRWHVQLAERAKPELRGPDQISWLDRLALDYDDLRAALEWAAHRSDEAELWARLACALHRFWALRGYVREGREWLERAAAHEAIGPALRAEAAWAAAGLAFDQGDYRQAEALSEKSLEWSRHGGDALGIAMSLTTRGRVAQNRGNFREAVALLDEAATVARSSGQTWALAQTLNALGTTARGQRDYARARAILEESLTLWRALGDKSGLAVALGSLGIIARFQGDYGRARALHEESLALRRELGDRLTIATSLGSLGAVFLDQGDYERAEGLFNESLTLCRELGDKLDAAAALGNLGIVAHHRRESGRATSLLEEAMGLWQELANTPAVAASRSVLGMIALAEGNTAKAAAQYREGLRLSASLHDKLGIAKCLTGLARVAAAGGAYERAARFFGSAEALREAVSTPMPTSDRPAYDHAVTEVRAALSASQFIHAWQQGWTMLPDAVIAEALATDE
jgi:predicted ATPase/class 3 adenylate cyclase